MSVTIVPNYVTTLQEVLSVGAIIVTYWMMMDSLVTVCTKHIHSSRGFYDYFNLTSELT